MAIIYHPSGLYASLNAAVAAAAAEPEKLVHVDGHCTDAVTVAHATVHITIAAKPGLGFRPIFTYTGGANIMHYYTEWQISGIEFDGGGTATGGLIRSGGGTSADVVFEDVIVHDVVDIAFDGGTNAQVNDCVAYNCKRGFEASSTDVICDSCLAVNCTGVTGYGFSLDNDGCRAFHCVAAGCVYGFRFAGTAAAYNSIAKDNTTAGFWIGSGTLPVEGCGSHGNGTNWSVGGTPQATPVNCSSSDPLFVGALDEDPTHYQLSTSPASPALEFCISTVGKATDYFGNTRPFGAPDAGIWERQDITPPTILHTPVTGAVVGNAVSIEAEVTDDLSGVTSVTLFYRVTGTSLWSSTAMANTGADFYAASIPAGSVTTKGVDYYIRAIDGSSNEATHPAGAP